MNPTCKLTRSPELTGLDIKFSIVSRILHLADAIGSDRLPDETMSEFLSRAWSQIEPHADRFISDMAELKTLEGRP